jgi:hypothetical protein
VQQIPALRQALNRRRNMTDNDYILKWTEELKAEIKLSEFANQDIRKDFLKLIYDNAYSYYRASIVFDLANFIIRGKILFNNELSFYIEHFKRFADTANKELLQRAHLHYLNRSLLFDCWSAFELCVTTFCSGIVSTEKLEKLLSYQYNDVIKELRVTSLEPAVLQRLQKLLKKEHLTHVPIVRKTDFLFSSTKNYPRNKEADKAFLIFYGKFRNTTHTNFIYYGKDYEYYFNGIHFIFQDSKIVKWNDQSFKTFFQLVTELKEIWKALSSSIDFKEVILYPDNDQI